MILLAALVVSFVVGVLRGGALARLVLLPFRWPAIPVLSFAAQAMLMWFPEPRSQGISLHAAILATSYLVLLLTVWVNRRIPGMLLLGLGLSLNLAVMVANGGYMPITPEAMQRIGHRNVDGIAPGTRVVGSKDIALPRDQTHLWFLSDVLVFPPPFPIPSAFSLGDLCIAMGAFVLVQHGLGLKPRTAPWDAALRDKRPEDTDVKQRDTEVLVGQATPARAGPGSLPNGDDHVTARARATDRHRDRRTRFPRPRTGRQSEVDDCRL
jgi:hypothetical protein